MRTCGLAKVSKASKASKVLDKSKSRILLTALPIVAAFAFLWFPFDWLSEVWSPFGNPFRVVFHDARSHFYGHTVLFLVTGIVVLIRLPVLARKPVFYIGAMVAAALVQEAIQALFRNEIPRFNDFNAFRGDALGSFCAFMLVTIIGRFCAKKSLT